MILPFGKTKKDIWSSDRRLSRSIFPSSWLGSNLISFQLVVSSSRSLERRKYFLRNWELYKNTILVYILINMKIFLSLSIMSMNLLWKAALIPSNDLLQLLCKVCNLQFSMSNLLCAKFAICKVCNLQSAPHTCRSCCLHWTFPSDSLSTGHWSDQCQIINC